MLKVFLFILFLPVIINLIGVFLKIFMAASRSSFEADVELERQRRKYEKQLCIERKLENIDFKVKKRVNELEEKLGRKLTEYELKDAIEDLLKREVKELIQI